MVVQNFRLGEKKNWVTTDNDEDNENKFNEILGRKYGGSCIRQL